jgi:hypothetical protein
VNGPSCAGSTRRISSGLNRIRWCPVQFESYVAGPNGRVHTVGERAFATRIETDAVDYR